MKYLPLIIAILHNSCWRNHVAIKQREIFGFSLEHEGTLYRIELEYSFSVKSLHNLSTVYKYVI